MRLNVLILFWIFSQGVCADSASDRLQKKMDAIVTLRANFTQVVKASSRVISKSTGVMAVSKPERFRWQIESPMAQLIVADSHRLWVYDVELEQVTVKPQGQSLTGSPALFLSRDHQVIEKEYDVTEQLKKGQSSFELKAKSAQSNFQQLKLTFLGEVLKDIEFVDQLGQQTTVTLDHVKLNTKLSPSLFQFKPPKGVDIVEQ